MQTTKSTDPPHIHTIAIIGAGPCGLAVAARLHEPTSSALFTESEHQRYHWLGRHSGRTSVVKKNGKVVRPQHGHERRRDIDMLVLDAEHDDWMGEWTRLFGCLGIEYLRSPAFFHVDPRDRDGLLEFAASGYNHGGRVKTAVGAAAEFREIRNCVGKELSKHKKKKVSRQVNGQRNRAAAELEIDERDRKDYFAPSTKLFANHCASIIDRYSLGSLVRKAKVLDIDYVESPLVNERDSVFKITTAAGVYFSKTAVLAGGSYYSRMASMSLSCGMAMEIEEEEEEARPCCDAAMWRLPNVTHSNDIDMFPSGHVQRKIKNNERTHVLVVGGGLTAAQLVDLALQKHVTHVTLVMRSRMKVKPFDVDLAWLSKFKNHEKAVFWSADSDEERLAIMQQARNGGSITPPYADLLKKSQASGQLTIHTLIAITATTYHPATQTTTIHAHSHPSSPASSALNNTHFDHIYLATGTPVNILDIPFLQTMHQKHELETCGGLPCLTHDLAWKDDVPLFLTGKLAGLRLGPGAGNLEGARMGAERVVWGVEAWLDGEEDEGGTRRDEENGKQDEEKAKRCYVEGIGSRFEC